MARHTVVALCMSTMMLASMAIIDVDNEMAQADPFHLDAQRGSPDDTSVVPIDEGDFVGLVEQVQLRAAKQARRQISDVARVAEGRANSVLDAALHTVGKDVTSLGESDMTLINEEPKADDPMQKLEDSLKNLQSIRSEASNLLSGAEGAVQQLNKVVAEKSADAATLAATGADGGKSLQEVGKAMDPSADKCKDFYTYACGGWIKTTEKPNDHASWSKTFSVISKRNMEFQKESYSQNNTKTYQTVSNEEVKMVKDYYASCMDKQGRDARGLKDGNFTKWIKKINSVNTAKELMNLYAETTLHGIDIGPFDIGVGADEKDATTEVLGISQGGIGLPSRSYYGVGEEKDNARFQKVRKAYLKFMKDSFTMAHVDADPTKVLAYETALAKIMWSKTQMRDPQATYFPTTIGNFTKFHLAWETYFNTVRKEFPSFQNTSKLILTPRAYFTKLEALLAKTDIQTLKGHALRRFLAKVMPATTVDAGELNFEFYGRALQGTKERPVLWKRCVGATTDALWGIADKMFVEEHFNKESLDLANGMVDEIVGTFKDRIENLPWMDATTKQKAQKKLASLGRKIGKPEQWRGYSGLEVGDDYLANMLSSWKVELKRNFDKNGKKVDPTAWHMNPSQTNAYYSPSKNEMVFPAGILQPPFFSVDQPTVLNFASIGAVIGHELTHGFDDQGSQFDEKGDMVNWWTDDSYSKFQNKTSCIINQYAGIVLPELAKAAPKLRINGELTLGENIADNGGVVTSLQAYEKWQKKKDTPTEYSLNGQAMSAHSLFWIGYAQTWCEIGTTEHTMVQIRSDPHSPARARVEGPLQNAAPFGSDMQCAAGTAMNPSKKCSIW